MVYLLAQVWLEITSFTQVTVTVPVQLSETPVTVLTFTGGTSAAHCTVVFAGQVNVGGVLSKTVII